MENNVIQVKLWNKNVGLLYWDEKKNISYFQFDKDFLKSGPDVSPISVSINPSTIQKGFPLQGNPSKPHRPQAAPDPA